MIPAFDTLNRSGLAALSSMDPIETGALLPYWRDPSAFIAEREAGRTRAHAAIDAGMATLDARQAARWERGA